MPEIGLKEIREACGCWDENDGCDEGYPEGCPCYEECEEDADKEGKVK